MAVTAAKQFKITYTSANADMGEFHRLFDEALAAVRKQFGTEHPLYINGKAVKSPSKPFEDTTPIDTSVVLGRFASATPEHVDQAVRAAKAAQKAWAKLPWQERVNTLRRAAELIRERKFEIGAIMSVEVGKSRMEAMGDAEESADLIDYYCQQVEDANGFVRPMNKMTPIERNTDVLRPYGVFTCIAPFNFPMALSTGMSSAALVAGNAVVYKPAQDTPWTGIKLYEVLRDAGVPAGVFNYVSGQGSVIGDPLWQHPLVDGVVFTGSKAVGMRMFHEFSQKWVKPCLMELGGKNPCIVMDSADLDMAAEGAMRSAFGLQNQKCSATSRVYVHKKVAKAFTEKLLARTKAMVIGDPSEKDVYFGPVINAKAVKTWERAVDQAKKEGTILHGGARLSEGKLAKGNFVAPTIAALPLSSSLFFEELFVPFLAVGEVDSLEQAIAESNKAEYGLTAGFYSAKPDEIEKFFDEIESGVTYVNKRSGATTGAWPGAQPFTGWKGSGSSGKGGCGPYYVAQFLREQSRTVVEEKKP
ncbi:MAG TPA: aldehyde dehydrogenase family protein [Elusimicrobiota bacterium]|jgi:1-pyrroline-5-carboxylate dehydrogenase|nr:aldehyde dehydrogenase family protein [Elusimicrobiota bacterium]